MKLLGWNVIPWGYGARFDTAAAPLPLRMLFHTPFLDRFAYPQLVRRGHACLAPSPAVTESERGGVPNVGWRLDSDNFVAPGSRSILEEGSAGGLRR